MLTAIIIVTSLLLPLYLIHWLGNDKTENKSQLLVKTLASFLFIYTLYLFNNWAFSSYYLRYLLFLLFLLVAFHSWWKSWHQPWRSPLDIRQWAPVFGGILLMTLCGMILVNITGAGEVPEDAVEVEFPFRNGIFYMSQAGSSPGMNGHMAVGMENSVFRGQTWALDIVQLNRFGARAGGIYPDDPEHYFIFGTPVYSPCDGMVNSIENDLPDLNPPERDRENLAGNYVQIKCDSGFYIILAHLKQGSLEVTEGDILSVDSFLGLIGNSGNTTEPHLHIHAQTGPGNDGLLDADPVPVKFRNIGWLKRNDVVKVQD